MKVIDTEISDVKIIEPVVFGDERGFFMETWQQKKFCELVCNRSFVQDNHSKSAKNILRGLHYQTQNPQGKLVRVVSGEVFDVAVDMRKSSATFGQWSALFFPPKTNDNSGSLKALLTASTFCLKVQSLSINALIITTRSPSILYCGTMILSGSHGLLPRVSYLCSHPRIERVSPSPTPCILTN
jgi:dTDP-4-dehydrorhamnose 3,5-epimerase-like enzyme